MSGMKTGAGTLRLQRPGRHPQDRAVLALAAPALASLAADPLYSLVDTAFVGNLGTEELGAVAVGTAAFTASFWLFSFLAYGVTPRVARSFGSGQMSDARRTGVQALILALGIGALLTAVGTTLADPIVRALGAVPEIAADAETYLRIRVLSAAPVLVVQVGNGWMRGVQDTRTPMYIATAGAALNVVLDYALIYPAGLGVAGAAWATVIGQSLAAGVFLLVLGPRLRGAVWRVEPQEARSLLRVGADLIVRTGSLLGAMTLATSVAARMGVVTLGAWQVTMQIFLLLALSLDSVAIAAQALIGKFLGAGDPEGAKAISRRLMEWGLMVGVALTVVLVVLRKPIAGIFSDDPEVVLATAGLLVWLALVQPLSGLAFTLDGILIGASDTRFLAGSMLVASAVYAALALVALTLDWGTAGLALGATVWLLARTVTTGARWARGHWALS
jgi:putative MATE family efflux protein